MVEPRQDPLTREQAVAARELKALIDPSYRALTPAQATHRQALDRHWRTRQERLRYALSKLESGVCDSEPVLLKAQIELGGLLHLWIFDHGKDLVGFRIREQCVNVDGTTRLLVEDYPLLDRALYPVFAHPFLSDTSQELLTFYVFAAWIREPCEPRDEEIWQMYITDVQRKLAEGNVSAARKVIRQAFRISRPVDNSVRVSVSVYDALGNESELEVEDACRE